MKRVFLPVGVMIIVVLLLLVVLVSVGDAATKPDIVMTPSHTDYLTVYGLDNCAPHYLPDSTNTGRLYCLPVRPE